MLLQQYQVTLQEKEKEMKLVKEWYEHHLHEVESEKERVQQQMQDYEQTLQQNHEQIEILREHSQAALRVRKEAINRLILQYEQQLHLFHQVNTESGSEKERLQKHIQDFEQIIKRNNEQIEILRRENKQGPELMGPVGEKYPMNKIPHGIAVIINNFEFHSTVPDEDPIPERRGSHVDEENLCVTWEYLQYDVCIFRNLTALELTHQLTQIALQSHENYDSFVCCILSHGYLDVGVYGADGKPVKIDDITSIFKGNVCPTLAGKPKLFFIQSERGNDEDKGVVQKDNEDKVIIVQKDDEDKGIAVQKDNEDKVMQADEQKNPEGDPDNALCHSLPSEADFLFSYSTPLGYLSWRSPQYGSWFISKLCEVLVDYASQQDLLSMLTIVNQKVSDCYTTEGLKQCPAPVTLLRKQIRLFENSLK